MKNNHVNNNSIQKIPLADLLEENQTIHWISTNGRFLLIAFFVIISLFFLAYRVSFGNKIKSEVNFINAENDYQRFAKENQPVALQENLDKLKNILSAMPELHTKYDGLIAQKLITENEVTASIPFAMRAIDRTKAENAPFYSDYSLITLLVAEQKLEQALADSLALKHSLLNSENGSHELLFASNLLRIATLQQQLNLKQEELNTWAEWKEAVNNHESFQKLLKSLNQEKISLSRYIEAREKLLKS